MPGTKRKYASRRGRPAKRQMRRPRGVRISRSLATVNAPHKFTRMVQYSLTNQTAANPYFGAATFGLNALPSYTEFTALFDQYRITFIKLYWQLNVAPEAQASNTAFYPRLYSFNDFTDVTVPTTLDEFRERSKSRVRMLNPRKPVITTIKPAVSTELFKTLGGVAVNAPRWKVWLPAESADVQHLGHKYAIENWTNANYSLTLTVKYWFEAKQVK